MRVSVCYDMRELGTAPHASHKSAALLYLCAEEQRWRLVSVQVQAGTVDAADARGMI